MEDDDPESEIDTVLAPPDMTYTVEDSGPPEDPSAPRCCLCGSPVTAGDDSQATAETILCPYHSRRAALG